MKTEQYKAEDLANLLHERTIATMEELKAALKTDVYLTVLRKLRQLGYITSYSHRGQYYSLEELAQFDDNGLWMIGQAHFSRYGTLLATAEAFVTQSDAGYYAAELESLLDVSTKETLLGLFRKGSASREMFGGSYLYCSPDPKEKKRQLALRRALLSEPFQGRLPEGEIHDDLKAAIILFFCLLDEQQRRLFAGLESLKWGHGGDRKVADLLGIDVSTVARGRRALLEEDVEVDRVRKPGGGRKTVEKKRPKSSRRSKS
ncbi:MAG: hypothetical protein GY854_29355 [Deltaproteobacteria bacterium]|nr:hypothetical protein [Deltaproteobacteria bacterium]